MIRTIFIILIFFAASSAKALQPHDYHDFEKMAAFGDKTMEVAQFSYHQGIYETLRVFATVGDLKISFENRADPVCFPSLQALSRESVKRAIALEIGTYKEPKISNRLQNIDVAAIAVFGLSKIFPCS
ncbi:hypothetical protein C9974_14565 [Marinobacter sp. B9-2]|nr:hypothetical protein C9974_14565 [Marinobacter sp. B9-2]